MGHEFARIPAGTVVRDVDDNTDCKLTREVYVEVIPYRHGLYHARIGRRWYLVDYMDIRRDAN